MSEARAHYPVGRDEIGVLTATYTRPFSQTVYRNTASSGINEAAKKVLFLVATKAFSPPPLGLVAIGTFFLTLKKGIFSF